MHRSRIVGAGAFVLIGILLFTGVLFTIGNRRSLFSDRFTVYTEYATLGELQPGAIVRVAGMEAGEVTDISIPRRASDRFRVEMKLREDVHHLIRADSVTTTQTEGLVGAIFVAISKGTDESPIIPANGTIPSREPFGMADLLQQASNTVALVTDTVQSLRDDAETAVRQAALTATEAHTLFATIRPDIERVTQSAGRVSVDVRRIMAAIAEGQGTLGKLINDDKLYVQAREVAHQADAVLQAVRGTTEEVRRTVADFNDRAGPARGLINDMRETLAQAREATTDLADSMEALKHNFLLRGFFNRRGYFDLGEISPAEYRQGAISRGGRTPLRIWLGSDVLFSRSESGEEALTPDGRVRIDSAMAAYLEYLPAAPLIVEGYATEGAQAERFTRARRRAVAVRTYIIGEYHLSPSSTGLMPLGDEAPGSPTGDHFDGVALALFPEPGSITGGSIGATR